MCEACFCTTAAAQLNEPLCLSRASLRAQEFVLALRGGRGNTLGLGRSAVALLKVGSAGGKGEKDRRPMGAGSQLMESTEAAGAAGRAWPVVGLQPLEWLPELVLPSVWT